MKNTHVVEWGLGDNKIIEKFSSRVKAFNRITEMGYKAGDTKKFITDITIYGVVIGKSYPKRKNNLTKQEDAR